MKYMDLHPKICQELHLTPQESSGCNAAMSWLDMHPGQEPGRTLMESRFSEIEQWVETGQVSLRAVLIILGFTFEADPEPTNAEKATADLETWGISRAGALELGPWLAGQGWVKAPEDAKGLGD